MFHLAGIPSYVVGEVAINRTLRGTVPAPAFPELLRTKAPEAGVSEPNPILTTPKRTMPVEDASPSASAFSR